LIAAELVFGVSSGKGGLGWYIFENKNMLDIPAVFAGLFTMILIGLLVENVIFRNIEAVTVRRWGMQTYRVCGANPEASAASAHNARAANVLHLFRYNRGNGREESTP
jgi:hypothetical protein